MPFLPTLPPIRRALIFSDIHLGWVVCASHHDRWLARLSEAAGDAELIVMNGDIVDNRRQAPRRIEQALISQLAEIVELWRQEGRTVIYVEGNHDPRAGSTARLRPDRWCYDFATSQGERVRVLHGHRFTPEHDALGAYDRLGRHILGFENRVYGRFAAMRRVYRFGPGWASSAIGALECKLARHRLGRRIAPLAHDVDIIAYGHIHFGPGRHPIPGVKSWRTGA